jgi:excisionase family DNA binding protein
MRPEVTGRKILPLEERFGVTVNVAAEYVGISKSRIYELLQSGELEGRVIHGRRIVVVTSLLRMLGQAPSTKREKKKREMTARSEQSASP